MRLKLSCRSRTESETLEKSRKHAPIERSFERTSSRRYARRTIGSSSTHYIHSERSNASTATTSAVSSAARSGISSSVTSPALSATSGAPVSAPLAKVLMAVGSTGALQRHGSHTGSGSVTASVSSAPVAPAAPAAGRSPSYQSTAASQLPSSAAFTSPQQSVRSNGSAATGTGSNSILSAAVTHMIGELEKEHTQTRALLNRATTGGPPVAPPPPAITRPARVVSPPTSLPHVHPLNQMPRSPNSPPGTLNAQPQQQQQQPQNNRMSSSISSMSSQPQSMQNRQNAGSGRYMNEPRASGASYAPGPPMASPKGGPLDGDALNGNYENVLVGKKTTVPSPLPIIPPKVPSDLTNAPRSPSSAHRNSQLVSLSSSIAPPRTQQQQQPVLASAPPPPDSHFVRRPASMRTSSSGSSFAAASPLASGVQQPARNAPNNVRFASNLIAFRSRGLRYILYFRFDSDYTKSDSHFHSSLILRMYEYSYFDRFALPNRSPFTISASVPVAKIEAPPVLEMTLVANDSVMALQPQPQKAPPPSYGARVIQPPSLSTVPENNGIPDANAADFKRRSMLALNADSILQLPEQSARKYVGNANAGAPPLDSQRNASRVIAAPALPSPAAISMLNRSLSMPFNRAPDSSAMVHSMSDATNVTAVNGRGSARPQLSTSPTPSQSTSVSTLSNTFGSFVGASGAWRPAAAAQAQANGATAGDSCNFAVRLRPDAQGRFGFNIKGGSDQQTPVIVSKIATGMPADLTIPRLTEGDEILQVNMIVFLIKYSYFEFPNCKLFSFVLKYPIIFSRIFS